MIIRWINVSAVWLLLSKLLIVAVKFGVVEILGNVDKLFVFKM